MNSQRVLRRRSLPVHPELVFEALPTSPEDSPGQLDKADQRTSHFLDYEHWLQEQLLLHGSLSSVGDKDADNRYAAEVQQLREELEKLRREVRQIRADQSPPAYVSD